ncbi:Interferon-Induced Very Large Gtpase 1 [Manis pentadactyla]|nr:Interferon-Induced Very Large Gtpase 1 [Manis pentadactyla]
MQLLCIKDGRRSRTLQNSTKDQDQTDGILPASMSSLPILYFLLLLLRLQVPQAQGFPTLRPDQYSVIVTEILKALNESPLASQNPLNWNDKLILREFQPILPTPTTEGDQIRIEESNKGDFQRKLKQYLVTLNSFLRDRNRH